VKAILKERVTHKQSVGATPRARVWKGSRWLEGGIPLHVVRDWLGHTNVRRRRRICRARAAAHMSDAAV
jgi:hypothetical protein